VPAHLLSHITKFRNAFGVNAALPSSHLFNLSLPEREAIENYIHDSLANCFFRPSSSLGAGFFRTARYAPASITVALMKSPLRTNTSSLSLTLPSSPSSRPRCSPNWISAMPTTSFRSGRERNGNQHHFGPF